VDTLHGNTVRGIHPASPNSAADEVKFVLLCLKTGCGSGSGSELDPDSIGSVDPDSVF
jgi:hypothetical protein